MDSVPLLTQIQRQCLVIGFIKESIHYLPEDLTHLCYEFYDDIFEWTVPRKQFASLLQEHKVDDISRITTSQLTSPSYTIGDVVFQCKLSKGFYNEQIEFNLYIQSMPKHIQRITYFMQMFCTQILYEFRSFDSKQKNGKSKGWPKKTVSAQKLQQFDCLNLGCYLEILSIEYKEAKMKNYIKPISMKIVSEYKWEINGDLLKRFRKCENGRGFYAESFNNGCLCIIASPNGTIKSNEGRFVLGLKLLKIHNHLKRMAFRVVTKCSLMMHRFAEQRKKVAVDGNLVMLWPNGTFKFGLDKLSAVDSMWIYVKVEIVSLESANSYGEDIDIDCWSSYGIVK